MILARFDDELYPKSEIKRIRHTVRLFIRDENDLYWFLVIRGEDDFGVRDHYETIGGGIEKNESFEEAIIREVREEIGCVPYAIRPIGTIIDRYYLIGRETHSHFFSVRIDSTKQTVNQLTPLEQTLFFDCIKVKKEEVSDILSLDKTQSKVDYLVQRRDVWAWEYALKKNLV